MAGPEANRIGHFDFSRRSEHTLWERRTLPSRIICTNSVYSSVDSCGISLFAESVAEQKEAKSSSGLHTSDWNFDRRMHGWILPSCALACRREHRVGEHYFLHVITNWPCKIHLGQMGPEIRRHTRVQSKKLLGHPRQGFQGITFQMRMCTDNVIRNSKIVSKESPLLDTNNKSFKE